MESGNISDRINQNVLRSSVICTVIYTVIALTIGFITSSQVNLFDGVFNLVGIALTYLSILAVKFIKKPDRGNYPFGKEAFEPFIALLQYAIILYICLSNIVTAINTILQGGHAIDLLSGISYGLFGAVYNTLVFGYLKMLTKKHSSAIADVEIDQWKFSLLLSMGILVGFSLSWFLNLTPWTVLTSYVDPALTLVITIMFGRTAILSIKGCIRELLGAKPTGEIEAIITEQVNNVCTAKDFKDRILRFGKVGGKVIIEIDYVIEKDSPLDSVVEQDKLRYQL